MDNRADVVSAREAVAVRELMDQSGVVSRRQLLEAGHSEHDIRRMLRRRELTPIHRGVYVDHTGEPTWLQRAWAAVLVVGPAALCDISALRAAEGPGRGWDESAIHVAVATVRTVVSPPGVIVHRIPDLAGRVSWHLSPPRLHYDEAVIDVAQGGHDLDAVATLANAVGSRRTTAARLKATLDRRPKARRRPWLVRVLDDIEAGTWSVLEHGYLARVERPHGLPAGMRQVRHIGRAGSQYRDVEVAGRVIIELDGWAFHSSRRQHDLDLERDLDAAAAGELTIRLGFGQVFDHPCRTALKVATVLTSRGWSGRPTWCGPTCELARK